MTITATPLDQAGSAMTLCDGDSRGENLFCGPDALSGSMEPGAVTRRFAGDPGIAEEHTGNAEQTLAFSVLGAYATPSSAQAAALGLSTTFALIAETHCK